MASLKTKDVLDTVDLFFALVSRLVALLSRYCKIVRGMFCSLCDKRDVACARGVPLIQCLASFGRQ